MSEITTGVGTQARVVPSAASTTLVLIGADQTLTYQISATIEDVDGNDQSGDLYYVSRDPSIATVDSGGLVTAVEAGSCIVEVSTPAFGNAIALFSDDGSPLNKVYSEILVTVEPGQAIIPSFTLSASNLSASASAGSASTGITVTPSNGFVGTVKFGVSTETDVFDNNTLQGSVQALAGQSILLIGWPVITADIPPVTWNFGPSSITITDGPATFNLVLSWNGSNPPPVGTYSFNFYGYTSGQYGNPMFPGGNPDTSTVSLTLTLS